MPTNPISALPTPPSRNDDPDTFVTRSDAFVGALPQFVNETNALAGEIETDADLINSAIETAQTAAGNASESADNAAASATAAGVSEDNAEIFAAAAQSAIGVPSLAGNAFLPLRVNAAEDGVEFENLIAPAFAFAVKTDTASTNSGTFVDTGLSLSITPKRADSKILISAVISFGVIGTNERAGAFVITDSSNNPILVGDALTDAIRSTASAWSGRFQFAPETLTFSVLADAVNAAARTYKVRWLLVSGAGSLKLNSSDEENVSNASTLSAMEIFQ